MLIIPIFISHQGCPHDCLFCNQQKISGAGRIDSLPSGKITETIEEWLKREEARAEKRVVQVAFFGGSFTCLPRNEQIALLGEVQPFLASGQVDSIRCSTRPDCIDDAVCSLLQHHGVTTVELGVQSMDDRVLQRARRGHSAAHSRNALRILKKHRFTVGVQLMPGLPGESFFGFLRGLRALLALKPDLLRLYPALVIEDSALAELYLHGKFQPLSLTTAVVLCAAAVTLCANAGVTVIRVGLQASQSLGQSILAGPYHPAFGELVLSRLWLQRLICRLRCFAPEEKMVITVSHRDVSAVVGVGKENRKRLDALGFAQRYTIVADRSVAQGKFYVVSQ